MKRSMPEDAVSEELYIQDVAFRIYRTMSRSQYTYEDVYNETYELLLKKLRIGVEPKLESIDDMKAWIHWACRRDSKTKPRRLIFIGIREHLVHRQKSRGQIQELLDFGEKVLHTIKLDNVKSQEPEATPEVIDGKASLWSPMNNLRRMATTLTSLWTKQTREARPVVVPSGPNSKAAGRASGR